MKRIVLILLLFILFGTGCKLNVGGRSNPGDSPQTRILKIYTVPGSVAPGDTAVFVCVIRDSTNANFRFYWEIDKGTPIGGQKTTFGGNLAYMTSDNQIKWKAPNKPDTYYFEVDVNDSSSDLSIPVSGFQVTVKQ